jgi:hypothetical protein
MRQNITGYCTHSSGGVSFRGVEVAAGALLPLRRNDFSIDNLGVAYQSWHVGMLLSMRAVGSWLL